MYKNERKEKVLFVTFFFYGIEHGIWWMREKEEKNYKFKIFSLQKEVSGHENPALIHRMKYG